METIISATFALLLGVVGLWTGFRQLRNHQTLYSWNTTKGKVVKRDIYQPNISTLSIGAFRYAPLVQYLYWVGMKEFTGDCIQPKRIQLPEHNTREWAQKRADSFADEVTVYYNPEDPGESFLIQTPKIKLYIVIGVSGLIFLSGICFLLLALLSGSRFSF